ncbi:MAG: PTS transporter subunit EIIB [Anaeroplasmataceae bacterium]
MFLISKSLLIGLGIAGVVVVGIIITLLVFFLPKKKDKKIKVDAQFIENIINHLGGNNNIHSVTVDNARLKLEVSDVKKVDGNALKEMSGQGVFITGNNVKVLFKYDSKTIKKEIEKRL